MEIREGLLYAKSHEWVKEEGDVVTIGLTDYAQSELGDLVFVNLANKMTVSQLLKGMRAHPTYNEGIGEALEELEGGAIHVMPKKKK